MVRSNWIPTARISNVDSVMFVNRTSFELGEEIEKEIFSSCFFSLMHIFGKYLKTRKKVMLAI